MFVRKKFLHKRKEGKKRQSEFWKSKVFDMEEEIKIYRFLCGDMKDCKVKEWKSENKYYEYHAWREYVEKKLKNLSDPIMRDEFAHYLNLKREREEEHGMTLSTFMIPVTAAVLATFIVGIAEKIVEANLDVNSVYLSCAVTFAHILVLLGFIYIMIRLVVDPVREHNQETCFYKDYLQILEDMYPGEIRICK